jgi:cbb3-type cytochrome oxidase subunit 3
MLGEENNVNEVPEAVTPEPSENDNKTFVRVAGTIGGLILLTLICIAVVAFWYLPRQNKAKEAAAAATETSNAQVIQAMTATAGASLWTPTSLPSPLASNTPLATETPVVAVATNTSTQVMTTQEVQTATVAALKTEMARVQLTPMSTSMAGTVQAAATTAATALPQGGFADQIGLPGMIVMAIALVVVILLSRRLRTAPTR